MASLRVANDKLRERAVRVCVQATGCSEAAARAALAHAQDDLRVATVMLAHDVDSATAAARLEAAGGAIGKVVLTNP
jgi:N-acetylmuramic acid 6-phosphate etherase